MTKSVIAFGGVPTEPDVKLLMEVFGDSEPGTIITHEQLHRVVGHSTPHRYRTVVGAWRRRMERERGLLLSGMYEARGVGLKVLTAPDVLHHAVANGRAGTRKLGRSCKMLFLCDETELTEVDQKKKEFALFQISRIAEVGRESYKMLSAAFRKPELLPRSNEKR